MLQKPFKPPCSVREIGSTYLSRLHHAVWYRSTLWGIHSLLVTLTLSLLLSGCSTDDDRDICCEELRIDFRYSRGAKDIFPEHIHSLRHLLFDDAGRFVREIPAVPGNLQRLRISRMEAGHYTLVTLGNVSETTRLSSLISGVSTLEELELHTQHPRSDGSENDADPLYWGMLSFTVERNKVHRYLCDMSNIHCRLVVTVRWRDTQPSGTDPFTLQIREVPGRYALSDVRSSYEYVAGDRQTPVSSAERVVHRFPFVYEDRTLLIHRKDAPRLAGRVRTELRTLRYTDHRIPLLQVYRNGTPIMKEIDLAKPFALWGWKVNSNIEQVYEIEVELHDDGTVVVRPAAQTNVLDWVDGGSVG